ncbi:hypothetical protein NW766_011731 [Fusarium irregulare]|uniref:Uncharacterized protein n=1 Tax=Fusarium irregulare TaxID=2494466 RepID=A0A9W8PEV2_9HYPO|nr:hypothetical protein NW766_011731 [Fusarium irregulare]
MKWFTLVFAASAGFVTASPIARSSISPTGPCPEVSTTKKRTTAPKLIKASSLKSMLSSKAKWMPPSVARTANAKAM